VRRPGDIHAIRSDLHDWVIDAAAVVALGISSPVTDWVDRTSIDLVLIVIGNLSAADAR
jgi:hypothetical protein